MPRIPRAFIDEMVAHARAELPNEACGIVHAADGVPTSVHRVRNAAESPYRYMMDPQEQLNLELRRDREGIQLFAIYHSHVASEARPSMTDIRMAFFPPGEIENGQLLYPETYYILVSLAEEPPAVRAFHIRAGGVVEEEPIEVV